MYKFVSRNGLHCEWLFKFLKDVNLSQSWASARWKSWCRNEIVDRTRRQSHGHFSGDNVRRNNKVFPFLCVLQIFRNFTSWRCSTSRSRCSRRRRRRSASRTNGRPATGRSRRPSPKTTWVHTLSLQIYSRAHRCVIPRSDASLSTYTRVARHVSPMHRRKFERIKKFGDVKR